MSINAGDAPHVAVVIPCYKVRQHILDVLNNIGAEVSTIFVIDDCCPEASGEFVRQHNQDSRVKIITHTANQGVGGAVMTGYQAAIAEGADIIIKVDGDGQMNPALIPYFVQPIAAGEGAERAIAAQEKQHPLRASDTSHGAAEIDHRDGKHLSLDEFNQHYASLERPVLRLLQVIQMNYQHRLSSALTATRFGAFHL
jgi:glycosyltransferase involved in cell wall biosynthesis